MFLKIKFNYYVFKYYSDTIISKLVDLIKIVRFQEMLNQRSLEFFVTIFLVLVELLLL